MQETRVRSLGQKDPLENEMATTPVLLPEKSHEQRSLEGYSPWGHKKMDTTEQLSTHTYNWSKITNTSVPGRKWQSVWHMRGAERRPPWLEHRDVKSGDWCPHQVEPCRPHARHCRFLSSREKQANGHLQERSLQPAAITFLGKRWLRYWGVGRDTGRAETGSPTRRLPQ